VFGAYAFFGHPGELLPGDVNLADTDAGELDAPDAAVEQDDQGKASRALARAF
jgi:hypothetical protein